MSVKWNEKIFEKVRSEVTREIAAQTQLLQEEAFSLIATPKTGRLYPRGRGIFHQASAPGEPWANDTGVTRSKIRTEIRDKGLTGAVVFGGDVASFLEFGTSKMAPRPVARPALNNRSEEINAGIKRAAQRGMK